MSVCVVPDCIMSFGGTSDPCAQVTLSSIGNLGLEENKRISKSLSELLESALGLMPTRYEPKTDTLDHGFNILHFYTAQGLVHMYCMYVA